MALVGAIFLGVIAILPGIVDLMNSILFAGAYTAGTSMNAANVLTNLGPIDPETVTDTSNGTWARTVRGIIRSALSVDGAAALGRDHPGVETGEVEAAGEPCVLDLETAVLDHQEPGVDGFLSRLVVS